MNIVNLWTCTPFTHMHSVGWIRRLTTKALTISSLFRTWICCLVPSAHRALQNSIYKVFLLPNKGIAIISFNSVVVCGTSRACSSIQLTFRFNSLFWTKFVAVSHWCGDVAVSVCHTIILLRFIRLGNEIVNAPAQSAEPFTQTHEHARTHTLA